MRLRPRTTYVLCTGGAIDKTLGPDDSLLVPAETRIGVYLSQLRLQDTEVRCIGLMDRDGNRMTTSDRRAILDMLSVLLADEVPIVITHCASGIVRTGVYLHHELPGVAVPLILTCASVASDRGPANGLQNFTTSLFAAGILPPGVYVVMHNQVYPMDASAETPLAALGQRAKSG